MPSAKPTDTDRTPAPRRPHSAPPRSLDPSPPPPVPPTSRDTLPAVVAGLVCWIVVNANLLALAGRHLPLRASSLADPPTVATILRTNAMYVEILVLMVVVRLLTRHRHGAELVASRAPTREVAKRETQLVLTYGVAAMVGGYLLGRAFGWHAFGFHLDGMVIRTGQPVTPAEAVVWAAYNLLAYAVLPLAFFRRRYSAERLNLRSVDRRGDLLVVVVVLLLESAVQLLVTPDSILGLAPRQALLGAPLTFALSFAGTVLPTMVFVFCVLTPRYLRLTGSIPATVLLGGLTYALLHFFDGWTTFASPADALISVFYLVLFYTGPGMFKTYLTLRTANAWTHVWAYHAIAPHTLVDTPMFVRIFGIRG
ncbi:hypothetical protein SAMN05421678_103224 [Actinopolymorpha cephalotaxi]|uniref:CAAX protease self-immunity n=1 Tax=Actinopolymorpha cephalotaxi TaxID=504797 RepID=A0A1I2NBK6_9ACTN|nr:hypothetical protein [Actinopolymorpha cephalotaxi]NYH85670.1 hypothetical protein [Actinopolymorpha cephalotaxi]SFF99107.1 hypothetical protein SAMN05421678_103224 [Actinopolymorpha cephalotaxi]